MIYSDQNFKNLSNEMLKKEKKYLMFLGIISVIGGFFSLCTPLISSSIFIMIFGVIIMVLGIESIMSLFKSKGDLWSKIFKFLIAILYFWVGYNFFSKPLLEGIFLGIFGSFLFIILGIKKIIFSFKSSGISKNQNLLLLLSGILNLLLAGLILKNPMISILLIGIFIGLELLTSGIIYITISNHIKKLIK